ncbi:MAG: hypothetical protein AB8B78_12435, partial [Polaribacter sp.]
MVNLIKFWLKGNSLKNSKAFFVFILLFFIFAAPVQLYAQDTDGDGIADTVDLDDDNDGILDADEGAFFVANITLDNYSAIP